MDDDITRENKTLFQAFEWHTPSEPPDDHEISSSSSQYARITRLLPSLSALGITSIWLPPGCKANNPNGNGYDCYDLWDLGEFQQKGRRSTKWGNREELSNLLAVARACGVEVIWDSVLNHKTAGDSTEEAWAVEIDPDDRRYEICPPKKIEAWLRYDFPGRQRGDGLRYSKLRWRAEHFNATDWDQKGHRNAIYKLIDDPSTLPKPFKPPQKPQLVSSNASVRTRPSLFKRVFSSSTKVPTTTSSPPQRPGKGWADDVDDQHGNNDYLMFSNIDYTHKDVRADVINWGQWMVKDVGIDGFRLDAVQHFSYNFTKSWIQRVKHARRTEGKDESGDDVFIVGEVWTGEVGRILKWLDAVQHPSAGPQVYAYDAPLLYNFSRISEDIRQKNGSADLRTILRDSLLQIRPEAAVTLVTNHDTQAGQTSYTPMLAELKALFYAFILLRREGRPCVFWGDLFGTHGPLAESPACMVPDGSSTTADGKRNVLPDLMLCRRLFAYGKQKDYFDNANCIGFTRAGTMNRSGCAVVMRIAAASTAKAASRPLRVGSPGEIWVNILSNEGERQEVTIDARGYGIFHCEGTGVAVYTKKDSATLKKFPVKFDTDIWSARGPSPGESRRISEDSEDSWAETPRSSQDIQESTQQQQQRFSEDSARSSDDGQQGVSLS